ncbi:MAG: PLDc N-terminal domain-containing protein [Clostridia bacterium]|nr:PLDc N-terminal domain-containing protein [Clostridia bacterium]
MILGLAACGNSDSSSLAGEWKLTSIQEGEITMYASDLSAFDMEMVLTLKEDGSATMTMTGQDAQELTWKASGNKVTLTADGDAMDFTYKDNLLTGEMDEASMSFAKSDPSTTTILINCIFFAVIIVAAIWVMVDTRKRVVPVSETVAWGLFNFSFPLVGFIGYLFWRKKFYPLKAESEEPEEIIN